MRCHERPQLSPGGDKPGAPDAEFRVPSSRLRGATKRLAPAAHQETQQYLEQGVERAVAGIGHKVIDEACTYATQKVHEDVKHDLRYGEGGKAIRAAVHHALEPLTAILVASSGGGSLDDSDMADT
jgi:hypothetical protein